MQVFLGSGYCTWIWIGLWILKFQNIFIRYATYDVTATHKESAVGLVDTN